MGTDDELPARLKVPRTAHYLATGLCGEQVELLLKKECAPPIPSGQEQVVTDKGEALLAQ